LGGTNVGLALARSDYVQQAFSFETAHGCSPVIYFGEIEGTAFYHIPLHGAADQASGAALAEHEGLLRTWSALHELQVSDILGGATACAINPGYKIGDWVVPNDFIDFNIDRQRSMASILGPEASQLMPRYIPADDPVLSEILVAAAQKHSREVQVHAGGVIGQAAGGRFETAAEIRMFQLLGMDLVTLNIASEMAYARQLNINFASLIGISNPAEGLGNWDWSILISLYPKFQVESVAIYMDAVVRIGQLPRRRRIGDTLRIHPDFT
jgi:5'-methylthioadenosine phosphorylase